MITVKDYDTLNLHPTLQLIIKDLERFQWPRTITSLYRPGDKGVHGTMLLRGIDFREHSTHYGELVKVFLNNRWIYDPDRPTMKVCLFHDTGKGLHLHIQCHPNTVRRVPEEI